MNEGYKEKVEKYKKKQAEAKQEIRKKVSGKKKLILVVIPSISLLLGVVLLISVAIKNEELYNEQRHNGLDYYELEKTKVINNIMEYFYINSEDTWSKARTDMAVKAEYKDIIFGTEYVSSRYVNLERIRVIDASYTLKDNKEVGFYLYLEVEDVNQKEYTVNVLVKLEDGEITKIEGF